MSSWPMSAAHMKDVKLAALVRLISAPCLRASLSASTSPTLAARKRSLCAVVLSPFSLRKLTHLFLGSSLLSGGLSIKSSLTKSMAFLLNFVIACKFAPNLINSSKHSGSPAAAAKCMAVHSSWSTPSRSAANSFSTAMHFGWPFSAAKLRAVRVLTLRRLTVAPPATAARSSATSPEREALYISPWCERLRPFAFKTSMSSTNNLVSGASSVSSKSACSSSRMSRAFLL
mmetsp:Transcript_109978/g.350217  ORF Transcript_109978/g.350217 Transcript_109978/m.350217 type:complete len:230 (+) Transcript_109978:585-1274(+)